MSHLLDVNVLLASIWTIHSHHSAANAWRNGKTVSVCPLAEHGFLRISTNAKAPFNVSGADGASARSLSKKNPALGIKSGVLRKQTELFTTAEDHQRSSA
jgi:predicted nucleic acid-binding protein